MRTKLIVVIAVVFVFISIAYALDLRRSASYTFTSVVDVSITATHPHPFKLDSIVMTFSTPQSAEFQLLHRRGSGSWNKIYSATNATPFTTVTWIPEGTMSFTTNDTLRFSNSVPVSATLFYNYQI